MLMTHTCHDTPFKLCADLPQTSSQADQNSNLIPYVVAAAIVGVVVTAIVAGFIMACIIYCILRRCKSHDLARSKDNYPEKDRYSPTKNNNSVEMTEKI